MYEVNIIYCLLADILVLGGCLRFRNIHFLLADFFYLVGHLRLVILHLGKYGIVIDFGHSFPCSCCNFYKVLCNRMLPVLQNALEYS